MTNRRVSLRIIHLLVCSIAMHVTYAQCPQFPTSSIAGNGNPLCEGSSVTLSVTGLDIVPGSTVDWYIDSGSTYDPYNGEGTLIGSVPVLGDPCLDPPQVLYIMVNPDNTQVGGPGDQCDEFMVLWTGSGGFMPNDILVTNLGPGTFMWDSFVPGNASNFSCGVPLPAGPVPANAILIIQSSPNNNVFIDDDNLCASGLPVYIIAYDGTVSCTGGYFDNNSPCSSCPVMIDINGNPCQYSIDGNYVPPGNSVDGWGSGNTGAGVFGDVVPVLNIPVYNPPVVTIADFVWTVPADFCETNGGGDYFITGILNPPPSGACMDIFTDFFGVTISCPEMTLSGGGDVCEGNCPDNPTEISFSISGNDTPFEADIVVTASVFPPFQIPNLPIVDGQTILVCLGGIFPSFDSNTGILTVPTFAIGLSANVTIVSMVSASGCPVQLNQNSVTLYFIEAPTADAGSNQTICSYETISLSGDIGGSATEGMWTTDGDGDFVDPQDLNTVYTPGPNDIANGGVIVTLTGTDANGSCTPAESSITITIDPSVLIEVNTPLTICDNDVANIIATVTGSNVPCSWETSGDGSFDDPTSPSTFYTPGPGDIADGTVILTFLPDDPGTCLENSEPLILDIVGAPDVTLPQNLEICVGDSVVIDIDVQGDYTNVIWSAPGDGDLVVDNNFQVTYTPGPLDINNQFFIVSVTIQSAFPECGQITYNIPVNIILCDCPDLISNAPSEVLCAISDMIDLSGLLVAGGAGVWSITNAPPGLNPATLIGNLFTTSQSDPGTYTVTYTLNSPDPGCPSTTSESILVASPILPFTGPDMSFCGIQSVMMNGTLTPSSTIPILWSTSGDGSFSNTTLLNTVYTPGPVDSLTGGVFLTLSALDTVCGIQRDTVTLFFNPPPFAVLQGDTISICNTEDKGSILNFYSLIISGDAAGLWTNVSGLPIDFSTPDSVNFDGVAEGFYPFQYQTNSASSPCAEAIYTIIISVQTCLCPILIEQNVPTGICNNQLSLPLNAFIQAGAPGSWQIISTPPGTNPGSISGSTFIISGCDAGAYGLRFTFDAAPIDGCVDSAEIELFIQDLPTLVPLKDTVICSDQILNIQAAVGGSALNVDWSASGTGSFSADPSLMTSYTFSGTDIINHRVFIFAMLQDTFGFCPLQKDTMKVSIVEKSFILWSQLNTTVCNNPDSGSVVNFTPFIQDGDINPDWLDADGSGAMRTGGNVFDFDGVSPGVYTFIATTNNSAPPCGQTSYNFIVTVRNCSCPTIILSNQPISLCESSALDLNTEIINAAPGSWKISSGPGIGTWPQINGSNLSTTGAVGGNYILTYTLTDSVPGCPASADIPLQIESLPGYSIADIGCDSAHTSFDVLVQTNAATLTSDFGNVSSVGNGQFSISSIPTGQDISIVLSNSSGLCSRNISVPAPDCNCTLVTEDIADTIRFCPGDTFVLIPFITGAQGVSMITWVTPTGIRMRPTLPIFAEGQYIWIVKDSLGCENRDTFNAAFIGPVGAIVTSIPPTCPGAIDGQVVIQSVESGTPPYMAEIDSGPVLLVNQLPFAINNVGLGNHIVSITDMIGCTIEVNVSVENPDFGHLNLGPDVLLQKGDSTLVNLTIDNIGVSTVIWSPSFIHTGILPFWFTPDSTILVSAMVTDTSGCQYVDQLLITVYEKETFYIPNIFSPNGDQVNDDALVSTNLSDEQLVSFEIFDRWGSLLYGQYQSPPFHWNGTSKGKNALTGVYVYKLTWEDSKGKTNIKVGDITLIR